MKKLFIITIILILLTGGYLWWQHTKGDTLGAKSTPDTAVSTPSPTKPLSAFSPSVYVMVVNREEGITHTSYATAAKKRETLQAWLTSQHTTSTRTQTPVLDELVNEKLIEIYAKRNNLIASDAMIQEQYKKAVASVGTEAQYLEKLRVRGTTKDDVLTEIRLEILEELIHQKTQLPINVWLEEERKNGLIEELK